MSGEERREGRKLEREEKTRRGREKRKKRKEETGGKPTEWLTPYKVKEGRKGERRMRRKGELIVGEGS